MRPRHIALAVVIAAIWGVNFVAIDVGLDSLPPLLFAALRFVAAAFPAILFVRRPAVPWRWFALVGLPLGVGQFGLLFTGMHLGMPAGLSSLVLQAQALFTTIFAAFMLRERPRRTQLAGIVVAFAGIAVIGLSLGQGSPLFAFILCVAAAGMWGLANIGMRKAQPPDAFAFVVWVSLVPPLPLLALSLITEGPRADLHAITHISAGALGSLAYIAYLSTLVGYVGWSWLLRRYDAGQVAMYSLLVPPFGMSAAALFLGERITFTDVLAALLIVGGVALGSIRRRTVPAPAIETIAPTGKAAACAASTSPS
jgi:O-acetylserine/cysteine efflux transporter